MGDELMFSNVVVKELERLIFGPTNPYDIEERGQSANGIEGALLCDIYPGPQRGIPSQLNRSKVNGIFMNTFNVLELAFIGTRMI